MRNKLHKHDLVSLTPLGLAHAYTRRRAYVQSSFVHNTCVSPSEREIDAASRARVAGTRRAGQPHANKHRTTHPPPPPSPVPPPSCVPIVADATPAARAAAAAHRRQWPAQLARAHGQLRAWVHGEVQP
jgi:hypothetical protein